MSASGCAAGGGCGGPGSALAVAAGSGAAGAGGGCARGRRAGLRFDPRHLRRLCGLRARRDRDCGRRLRSQQRRSCGLGSGRRTWRLRRLWALCGRRRCGRRSGRRLWLRHWRGCRGAGLGGSGRRRRCLRRLCPLRGLRWCDRHWSRLRPRYRYRGRRGGLGSGRRGWCLRRFCARRGRRRRNRLRWSRRWPGRSCAGLGCSRRSRWRRLGALRSRSLRRLRELRRRGGRRARLRRSRRFGRLVPALRRGGGHPLVGRLGRAAETLKEGLLRSAVDAGAVAFDVVLGAVHRWQLVPVLRAPAVECGDERVEELDLIRAVTVENGPHCFDADPLRQAVADLRRRQHIALAERRNFLHERGGTLSAGRQCGRCSVLRLLHGCGQGPRRRVLRPGRNALGGSEQRAGQHRPGRAALRSRAAGNALAVAGKLHWCERGAVAASQRWMWAWSVS